MKNANKCSFCGAELPISSFILHMPEDLEADPHNPDFPKRVYLIAVPCKVCGLINERTVRQMGTSGDSS
jgi:hypothetical protein